jgi:DNA-binding LytR/AlgR family response regulator
MTEPIRVLIADDEPPARALLGHLLTKLGAQVVAEAEDGTQAVRLAELLNPDCALLDIAMPGLSGMDAARELVRLPAPPAIIFCTAFDGYAVAAFEVRAADYLLKPVEEARLAQALQRVAEAKPKIVAPVATSSISGCRAAQTCSGSTPRRSSASRRSETMCAFISAGNPVFFAQPWTRWSGVSTRRCSCASTDRPWCVET